MVERGPPEMPLAVQAELLGLSRSSLYYQPVPPSAEEVALKHRIDEIYTAHPFYGSRRITVGLQRDGLRVNRKAVQRHRHEREIGGDQSGTAPQPVSPYLPRHVSAAHPHHVWGIDSSSSSK